MNLYDYITEHKKIVNTLVRSGVVSLSIVNNLGVYDFYLDNIKLNRSKSMSIVLTMERFNISQKTIYNIIKTFTEPI